MIFSSGGRLDVALSPVNEATCRANMTNMSAPTWPRITVIIPIRNEEQFIARTLEYILGQDYPEEKLEVLVVDGESTDATRRIVADVAEHDRRVRLLDNPQRLSSAARALGVSQATGEVVTFVDGHVYIDNQQLLKNTALLLHEKQVAVLSRPQFLETPENDMFQQAVALARRSILGHGLDSTIFTARDAYVNPSSSGAAYRREVFERVGNFDVRFDACEDVEFNHRVAEAGFKSFTSMRLVVFYYPRETVSKLFHQMSRYGMGRFRLARKHIRTLSMSTLIPFLFVFGLPLAALAGAVWRPALWVALTAATCYVMMVLAGSVALSAKHGWKYLRVLPQIFWTIHTGLGWGYGAELWRTLTGRAVSFRKSDD